MRLPGYAPEFLSTPRCEVGECGFVSFRPIGEEGG